VQVPPTFSPTSGTGIFDVMTLSPTINQTGGANGITRGIYITPTLTAAADFRALEITNNANFAIYQSGASATNYINGLTGIGTTTPTAPLFVRGAYGSNDAFTVDQRNGGSIMTASASGVTKYELHNDGTFRLNAYGAGALTTDANGNVTAVSDARLKNIQGDFTRGLSDILKIDPKLYMWNATSGLDMEHVYAGFIAQNIQTAIPEAVMAGPSGYLSLQDRPILAALVNAIKEQEVKLDATATVADGNGLSFVVGAVKEQESKIQTIADTQSSLLDQLANFKVTGAATSTAIVNWNDLPGVNYDAQTSTLSLSNTLRFVGKLIADGEVAFNGVVNFFGQVTFGNRVNFTDKDMGGLALIHQGDDEVKVIYDKPYPYSPIVTVSSANSMAIYEVADQSPTGFTIRLLMAANTGTKFSWTALAIKNAKTSESGFKVNLASPSALLQMVIDEASRSAGLATQSGEATRSASL
jgi:hypothetical protein